MTVLEQPSQDTADTAARYREDLAAISKRLRALARSCDAFFDPHDSGDPGAPAFFRQAHRAPPLAPAELERRIRAYLAARRARHAVFGGTGWTFDPAWDMSLELLADELAGRKVPVTSACISAGVAPTTALRWIAEMEAAGMLCREEDQHDRRRRYLRLDSAIAQRLGDWVAMYLPEGER